VYGGIIEIKMNREILQMKDLPYFDLNFRSRIII
jgi:hypothetical protein